MAIWQDLVDTCGFTGSYQSVQRFVHKLHPSPSPEARVVIETAAGEDYGESPRHGKNAAANGLWRGCGRLRAGL
jgi:hypothetical protein